MHRSKATKKWLQDQGVRQFNAGVWPPNSPDMNIIENLWPQVVKRLDHTMYKNKDSLWKSIQSAFLKIPQGTVLMLYQSFPIACVLC